MPADREPAADLPHATLQTITGGQTLLILVPGPGAESRLCGGLIAQSCRRGRPPFIMVLGDGTSTHPDAMPADRLAAQHERETRAAISCLGLPRERLLMVGLFDGTLPQAGPVFEAVVRAVTLVMWARDCNVICAPAADDPVLAARLTGRIADTVAARSEVGRIAYLSAARPHPVSARRLDITGQLAAKRAAIAAHALLQHRCDVLPYEILTQSVATLPV